MKWKEACLFFYFFVIMQSIAFVYSLNIQEKESYFLQKTSFYFTRFMQE